MPAQEPCAPGPGSAAIEGAVREAAAGVALPGASVVATWEGGRSEAVADGGGRFVLCDLPVGEPLRVRAAAAGFGSEVVELRLTAAETSEIELAVSFGPREAAPETKTETGTEETVGERWGFRGRVVGRVLDAETGAPVEGALVGWGSGAYEAATSSEGAFALERVPAGEGVLRVQHLAYGERTASVAVPMNATVEVELRLAPEPIELEPLTVTVTEVRDRSLEIRGFYGRKEWGEKLGLGHFLTRDEIERRNPRLITDMVADVPSVGLDCTRTYRSRTCDPKSVRAPRLYCVRMKRLRGRDSRAQGRAGRDPPRGAASGRAGEPSEVAAMEVYTSASETPAEYGGATGQCGAVVIWTRTGR